MQVSTAIDVIDKAHLAPAQLQTSPSERTSRPAHAPDAPFSKS